MLRKFFIIFFVFILTLNTVLAKSLEEMNAEYKQLIIQRQKMMQNLSENDVKKLKDLEQRINQLRQDIQQESRRQSENVYQKKVQEFNKQIDTLENEHIRLMENLKTCTPASATLIFSNRKSYVFGSKNGLCYYRQAMGTYDVDCAFPMSVIKTYAQESINAIKYAKESSYVETAINKYCKIKK